MEKNKSKKLEDTEHTALIRIRQLKEQLHDRKLLIELYIQAGAWIRNKRDNKKVLSKIKTMRSTRSTDFKNTRNKIIALIEKDTSNDQCIEELGSIQNGIYESLALK